MKNFYDAYDMLGIADLEIFDIVCIDKDAENVAVDDGIHLSFLAKGDELFSKDKYNKAFEYYKMAHKLGSSTAPYIIGSYFIKGLGDKIVNEQIAIQFFKEAINRGESRGFAGLATTTRDKSLALTLWEKYFKADFTIKNNMALFDYSTFFDYRIVFLYEIQGLDISLHNKAKEILNLIRDSIIKDKTSLLDDLEQNAEKNETIQNLISTLHAVIDKNFDDFLFPIDETITEKLDNMLKNYKKNTKKDKKKAEKELL